MKRSTGVARIASSRICVLDVRRHELGRALLDRLLDVRLGGGVHDHVHLGHDLAHELGVADVAVHEREALVREHLLEVVQVARVRERVERHDLARRRVQQVPDDVRRDEPAPPVTRMRLGLKTGRGYRPSLRRGTPSRARSGSARAAPAA